MEGIWGEAEGGRGDDDLKLDDEDDEFKDGCDAKGDGDPGEGQDNEYFVAPVRGVPPIQHCTETERLYVGSSCLFFFK